MWTHHKPSWFPHTAHPWHFDSPQPGLWCSACWDPGSAAAAQRCSRGWPAAGWWSVAASCPRWSQSWPGRTPASVTTASTWRVTPCWVYWARGAAASLDLNAGVGGKKEGIRRSGDTWLCRLAAAVSRGRCINRTEFPHRLDFRLWPISGGSGTSPRAQVGLLHPTEGERKESWALAQIMSEDQIPQELWMINTKAGKLVFLRRKRWCMRFKQWEQSSLLQDTLTFNLISYIHLIYQWTWIKQIV